MAKIRPRVAQGGQGGQDETRMVKGGQMRPRMAKDSTEQQGGGQCTVAKGDGRE